MIVICAPRGSLWSFSARPTIPIFVDETLKHVQINSPIIVLDNTLSTHQTIKVMVGDTIGMMHHSWFSMTGKDYLTCMRIV